VTPEEEAALREELGALQLAHEALQAQHANLVTSADFMRQQRDSFDGTRTRFRAAIQAAIGARTIAEARNILQTAIQAG
jgi:hypothetical protein